MKCFRLVFVLWLIGTGVAGWAADTTNTAAPMLSLTLQDCIGRALTANLDIKLQRLNPKIADWNVVQALGVFDPTLTASANYSDTTLPGTSTSTITTPTMTNFVQTFVGPVDTRRATLNGGLAGKLETGTGYALTAGNSYTTPEFLPYSGGPALTVTQPLLRNFGTEPNLALVRVARQLRGIAGQQFILQVITTISAVENAYYELIYAVENHKATVEDLDRAKQLLDEDRKRLQIGTLSPLDVVQAESGVANSVNAVIVAARTIKDNENTLKRLISQNVLEFTGKSLMPVNYPQSEVIDPDLTNHIRTAFAQRPDFIAAKQELERRNILVKYNKNQLLPEVDLQGSAGLAGAGRTPDPYFTSIGQAMYPAWGVGISVSFPLDNRNARANYNVAKLQSDQQVITLKGLEQDIIVAVDNALRLVQSSLKSIDATEAASRLALESLKAEETKLQTGTSTSFLVLQAQSVLAAARSAEIRARADYAESLVALAQAEGSTLQRHRIKLDMNF